MDAEKGFRIDGSDYPVPDLDAISMGEAMLLEGYGVQLAKLGPGSELTVGVLAGLMHVAVKRKHLGMSDADARALVEKQNLVAALDAFADAVGEEDPSVPLDVTSPENETSSSTSSTGKVSENGSALTQEDDLSPTGRLRSVTSHPSARVTSAT